MVISSKVAIFVVDRLTEDLIFLSSKVSKMNPPLFCPINLKRPGLPVTDTNALKFIADLRLFFNNFNSQYAVTLTDIVYHIYIFNHFAKASMVSVKMCGIVAAMADEKL